MDLVSRFLELLTTDSAILRVSPMLRRAGTSTARLQSDDRAL